MTRLGFETEMLADVLGRVVEGVADAGAGVTAVAGSVALDVALGGVAPGEVLSGPLTTDTRPGLLQATAARIVARATRS